MQLNVYKRLQIFIYRLGSAGTLSFVFSVMSSTYAEFITHYFNTQLMNALRNKVQLIGHLGQEPEVTVFEKGNKMARFSIATNETYRNGSGEKVTDTQWHQVVAWGKTADIVESYLNKGKEVAVEGKLIHRQYEAADGQRKYITEVKCTDLLLLGKP
jgi:single-strand DNA-binding protein